MEIIANVYVIFMADIPVSEYYIATEFGVCQDHVNTVIHNKRHMSKVSARCVPKHLEPDLKCTRVNISRGNIVRFEADPNSLFQRYVTVDKNWDHHFQLQTKQQSKQWKHLGYPPSKEGMFISKVMASNCWDAEGVLLVDYQDNGHTITGAYYTDNLKQQRDS